MTEPSKHIKICCLCNNKTEQGVNQQYDTLKERKLSPGMFSLETLLLQLICAVFTGNLVVISCLY